MHVAKPRHWLSDTSCGCLKLRALRYNVSTVIRQSAFERRLNTTLQPSSRFNSRPSRLLTTVYGMQRFSKPLQALRQSHARQIFPRPAVTTSLLSTAMKPGGASSGSSFPWLIPCIFMSFKSFGWDMCLRRCGIQCLDQCMSSQRLVGLRAFQCHTFDRIA